MEENSPKVKHRMFLNRFHTQSNIWSKINKIPTYVKSNDLLFSHHKIAISTKPTPPNTMPSNNYIQ
jgi:hypothetical protein